MADKDEMTKFLFELTDEEKGKLADLASAEFRSMGAWLRNIINIQWDAMLDQAAQTAGKEQK